MRLLFSCSLFTLAFIWMAITAYDVDEEEIRVFLVMSLLFLGLLIAAGLVFALIIFAVRKTTRREGLLAQIEAIEKDTADDKSSQKDQI